MRRASPLLRPLTRNNTFGNARRLVSNRFQLRTNVGKLGFHLGTNRHELSAHLSVVCLETEPSSVVVTLELLLSLGFPPPKRIGIVTAYPTFFTIGEVAKLNLHKAMRAWKAGRAYCAKGFDAKLLETIRATVRAYGHLD